MAKASDSKQVATRVAPTTWEVLQIGLLLEDVETVQDLLRPVVEEYAERLEREPEVQAILKEVRGYQARKSGVSRLPRARSRSGRKKN
jgi:hypothetical protein